MELQFISETQKPDISVVQAGLVSNTTAFIAHGEWQCRQRQRCAPLTGVAVVTGSAQSNALCPSSLLECDGGRVQRQ
jgi:hypothetical protein